MAPAVGEEIDPELVAVDDALRRLDAGTYGVCTACGSAIASERLDAIPSTEHCVRHRGMAELASLARQALLIIR
jgi:RNA polymerase-binding transcription factor DksA